jgi:hypothetical protein
MAIVARCRRRGWADACAEPATERDRQHQLAAGLMIKVYRIPAVKNRSVRAIDASVFTSDHHDPSHAKPPGDRKWLRKWQL